MAKEKGSKYNIFRVAGWCFLLTCWLVFAGPESPTLQAQNHPLQFQHLNIQDGLSQSTVYDSYQDHEGFMWFGTRDGLNRYDGYNFKIFREDPDDSTKLKQGTVRAITGNSSGNIWIGTDGGGLYKYSKQTGHFDHIIPGDHMPEEIITGNILSLAYDGEDRLWIGTRNMDILIYDTLESEFRKITGDFGQVWCLASDTLSKTVWGGTDQGLIRINSTGSTDTYLPGHRVNAIEIMDGQIWAGTNQHGLQRLKMGQETPENPVYLSDDTSVLSLLSHENRLWIGTAANGLQILDLQSHRLDHYKKPEGDLADNAIRSLYKDRTGTVWVGTNNSGLNSWSKYRSKFDLYRSKSNNSNTLAGNVVLSFAEDKKGRLWIGSDGEGISVLDREKEQYTYHTANQNSGSGINNNHIIALLTDRNENIWIGTDGGGLNRIDVSSGQMEIYKHDPPDPKSLSNNSVLALFEDSTGDIWVGTYRGLNRFDPDKNKFHRIDHSMLNGDRILSLLEDSDGYIWVGTYAGGLKRLDPQTGDVTIYNHRLEKGGSISSNRVQSLFEDENQKLWVGTYNGLNLYDKQQKSFEVFDEQDGLNNDVIYGILPDDNGHLWLSTNGGISRFNIETREIRNFTVEDGLQSNEFNGGAYFRNDRGELFFGGINGFNIVDPDNIPINHLKPPIEITSFEVTGEERFSAIKDNTLLHLTYNENFFSFEFAALDFVAVESNRYRYKLKGLDEIWVETGNRNSARYTNVPPDEYTFVVQAANSDGVWNRSGVSLDLKVLPPFWQTWWFRIFALLLIAGILYTMYRYRINGLLKVQRTRQRIAGALHDEVSATLSSITYFSEAVKRQDHKENSEKYLGLISESANDAKEKITDIIWSIDPEHDDWVDLLSKCRRFASDLFESKNIEYKLDIDTDIDHPLDVELRQNLWLIFKEMTLNAVRHSGAGKVNITFGLEGKTLILLVQDNGRGIEDDFTKKSGHGIKNIKKRARKVGADLKLETDSDIGTRWIMTVRMN